MISFTIFANMEIRPIAHIRTQFPEKFGVPRQSSLAPSLRGVIVFEPEFRNPDALRGLEDFDRIWLIWEFDRNRRGSAQEKDEKSWSALVRPPRLGGNSSMGVFATRSPFRPNPLGLSCVRVDSIEIDKTLGPVINVLGADLVDGTPIYDIKPYVTYADAFPESRSGFVDKQQKKTLAVEYLCDKPEEAFENALTQVISLDPRPSYQDDPQRVYGLSFHGHNIKFRVEGDKAEILSINKL